MFAECYERATIVARRQPFANLGLSHRSKDCSRPEDEVRPVIARSTCDEAIHLSRSHHGLLRFARNDDPKTARGRHCEERLRRSNPSFPEPPWIASLRSQ